MSKFFTQTSDKLYNRHDYKVIHKNGKFVTFDNYEDVKTYWYTNQHILNCVQVLNKKTKTKNKGFK